MSADDTTFEVSFASGRRITTEELRNSKNPLMPNGQHAWVISVIHGLDDPELALDRMELDEKSFIGVTDLYCLVCHRRYETEIRYQKCPQNPQ